MIFQGIKATEEGIFDLKGFYKLMKSWFSEHDYTYIEKDYKETQRNDSKTITVKWIADKKVDDYIKKEIEITFKPF